MNDHTDDFERKARARLQAELGRVSVPQGRPRRARPQAAVGWGKRLVGATALAALAALVLLVVAARIYVPEQTAGPAQPAERGERLYLLSTVGVEVDGAMATSGGRIRAFDPATQQDVWAVARPAFKIPVDSSLSETDETPLAPFPLPGFDETRALSSTQSEYRIKISPYWIDGAVSPDGATLYVAEPFTISALDAATGQVRWQQMADSDSSNVEYIAGGWPVLAGSADSTILYVQRLWSRGGKTDRWIDLLDARSGEQRGRIDLPANIQAGQMIAAPDATTLYYITHEQVLKIRNNQVDPKIYTIGTGIRDAALTPDGRTLYLLNGASELLRYDTATATLKLTSITLGILDIRSGLGGTLLLSPSADKLVVQVFDESYTEPKLYVADPTTGKRLATLPDPEVTEGRWLQGPTLAFDTSGAALYGVANFGAPNPTAWDDRLVRVNLADGSATSLLDLEIENVARLLVSQNPAPAEAATPPEAPQATATAVPINGPAERLYIVRADHLTAISSLDTIDSANGQTAYTLENVSSATLSPDGTRLYVTDGARLSAHAAADGTALWSTPIRDVVSYRGSGTPVLLLAPDGRTLYVNSAQIDAAFTEATFWLQMVDTTSGTIAAQTIPLPSTTMRLPADASDGWGGELFIAADGATLYHVRGSRVRFISLTTGADEATIFIQTGTAGSALSPDGSTLYVLDNSFAINVIDTASRKLTQNVETEIESTAHANNLLALTADGSYLVIGVNHQEPPGTDSSSTLQTFDTRSWKKNGTVNYGQPVSSGTLASSPQRSIVYAVADLGGVLSILRYDPAANSSLAPIDRPPSYVRDVLVGP
ncbi:MAG: PQQ-binding-like beta-propeller repeat protein [Herpetosiphonaceae bacterium]|nr:PQQ-binding-like beta-propeller repeat protein [Herpetosiphonaceae bacterium]